MSPRTPPPCTHERGPGTTVCLMCRRDERRATQERHAQIALRFGAAVVAVAAIAAVILSSISALTSRHADSSDVAAIGTAATDSATSDATLATPRTAKAAQRATHAPGSTVSPAGATAAVPAATDAPGGGSHPGTAPLPVPTLAEGRTDLGNGIFAVRVGRVVTVHFDTPLGRTRKPDKFEATVRATLPRVYGATADSALARVARGDIARLGNPTDELPARGIRLPAGNGWTLALWPETRPGEDGPLAVSYRATITR